MDREILVHVDLRGTPYFVGRLWARVRPDRENATFEYDRSWLEHTERFSLEPAPSTTVGTARARKISGRCILGAGGVS